mgnify:FL=1|jgi:hypothetical protein
MSNIYDFEFYQKKKEDKKIDDSTRELIDLLDSLCAIEGETFQVAVEDEAGNRTMVDINELKNSFIVSPDNDN